MGRKYKWVGAAKDTAIDHILKNIEKGNSLRSILSNDRDKELLPSRRIFNEWLLDNTVLSTHYARSMAIREDVLFDEILEISDKQGEDVTETESGPQINHNIVQRNRLQIDSRKWVLSRMNPKKYGDKSSIDHTSGGEKIAPPTISFIDTDK